MFPFCCCQWFPTLYPRGMRSGTLPHTLVVGLGAACELASQEMEVRTYVHDYGSVCALDPKLLKYLSISISILPTCSMIMPISQDCLRSSLMALRLRFLRSSEMEIQKNPFQVCLLYSSVKRTDP